jgi:hypothetical protein
MLRFGTKSLLMLIAVVALWLSTFSNFPGAEDVRNSILLLILIGCALMAYCTEARRRVFWLSFFAVIFVFSGIISIRFLPAFDWIRRQTETTTPSLPFEETADGLFGATSQQSSVSYEGDPAHDTVRAGGMLILATVAGFIGVYIYGQSRKSDT